MVDHPDLPAARENINTAHTQRTQQHNEQNELKIAVALAASIETIFRENLAPVQVELIASFPVPPAELERAAAAMESQLEALYSEQNLAYHQSAAFQEALARLQEEPGPLLPAGELLRQNTVAAGELLATSLASVAQRLDASCSEYWLVTSLDAEARKAATEVIASHALLSDESFRDLRQAMADNFLDQLACRRTVMMKMGGVAGALLVGALVLVCFARS